jgi:hypothetical protein
LATDGAHGVKRPTRIVFVNGIIPKKKAAGFILRLD